jgi:hypothetical protein
MLRSCQAPGACLVKPAVLWLAPDLEWSAAFKQATVILIAKERRKVVE